MKKLSSLICAVALVAAISCNKEAATTNGTLELNLTAGESVTSIELTGTPTGGAEKTFTFTYTEPQSIESGRKFPLTVPAGTYSIILINGTNGAQCKVQTSGLIVAAGQTVAATYSNLHFAVQLWADGPYWATTNLGADTPEQGGDFYAWGYTQGYTYNPNDSTFTPAVQFTGKGFPDYKTHAYSDMAKTAWGNEWSLPSVAQFKTLINEDASNKCEYTFITTGTPGLKVSGKEAGFTDHSVFFPFAGGAYAAKVNNIGQSSIYWACNAVDDGYANALYIYKVATSELIYTMNTSRYCGYSVRAVRTSL